MICYKCQENVEKFAPRRRICRECVRLEDNARAKTNYRKNDRREHNLFKKYGLTMDEYNAMNKWQNGGCLLCRKPCRTGRDLAVDHDPKTGTIRGLLCLSCNTALGNLNDDPGLLRRAALYLEGGIPSWITST